MAATVETISKAQKLSKVLETEAGDAASAAEHFRSKLAFETDPSDVYTDMQNGETGFIVIDARRPESYARGHIPGSINLPYRTIDAETTASLPKDKVLVTYCAGVYCNASTRAAAKLSVLGFRVKEMLDGLEGWTREGFPLEAGGRPMTVQAPGRP
jgi:rhodanese-related sulfurtransferase